MRGLIALCSLAILSCGGIQTNPTCQVEEYGIIQFSNATDEFKYIAVYRLKFDPEQNKYLTVGKPHTRTIEPMVVARLRLHPGVVLVVIDKINGQRYVSDPMQIRTCTISHINLKGQVLLETAPEYTKLESRRQALRCEPCPECPIPHFPGPLLKK